MWLTSTTKLLWLLLLLLLIIIKIAQPARAVASLHHHVHGQQHVSRALQSTHVWTWPVVKYKHVKTKPRICLLFILCMTWTVNANSLACELQVQSHAKIPRCVDGRGDATATTTRAHRPGASNTRPVGCMRHVKLFCAARGHVHELKNILDKNYFYHPFH